MLGYGELVIISLIVLLLFGGRQLPEIARGLGQGSVSSATAGKARKPMRFPRRMRASPVTWQTA